jgi:hypothetical protein
VHLEGIDPSKASDTGIVSHMLILDVRTRWASTHQMLRKSFSIYSGPSSDFSNVGRALDYRETIDSFVSRNKDLHTLELSDADWESIRLVATWLKSFRSATTEMSTTKFPMLSTTHAIFRGLQDDIKNILCGLPNSVPPRIKLGLTNAHRKLSDYYYQFDASPFYAWAACM